jgi:opacity protein-like surface antigen
MPCRLLTILALTSGLALASEALAQTAPVPESPASSPAVDPKPTGLAGFELLASVGYGTVTEIKGLKTNPYGPAFGFDAGYTFDMGFRLGLEFSYGLGRAVPQTYEYRNGEIDLTAESNTATVFLSIGYDLWLQFLILRYSVGLGATWMSWELGELEGVVGGYAAPSGSAVGFVFVPGLAVLWPFRMFEVGLGFDYQFQARTENPSGIVGQLLVGIKL